MKATALWHVSQDQSQLQDQPISLENGNCLIQSEYSLVSAGTEKLVARGEVPTDLYEDMKVPFMQGEFSFPLTYGYSLVGTVLEGPEELVNKKVQTMHPHQSMVAIPSSAVRSFPEYIPMKRAVLISNMETIINAIWDSQLQIGDRVLVAGYGIIGALLCNVLESYPGIVLKVIEPDPKRAQKAANAGHSTVSNADELLNDFDVAFNTSAHEGGLQTCIDKLAYEGTAVEMSWYGNRTVNIHLGGSFHHERKKIISSQVGKIPGHKQNRWDYQKRLNLVYNLLKNNKLDELITHEISFSDAPSFFDELRANTSKEIGTVIKY